MSEAIGGAAGQKDGDLKAIAQDIYDGLFTARDNDTNGNIARGAPDEQIFTQWLQWYRQLQDVKKLSELWLPYDEPKSGVSHGFFLEHPAKTGLTAVVIHGLSSSHRNVGPWARVFYELGFNVFTPDLRGCGANIDPGIPLLSQDRNMGIYDSRDMVRWIEQIVAQQGVREKIVLLGYSLGASIALQAISYDALPSNASAIVEDCGFDNLGVAVTALIAQGHPELLPHEVLQVRDMVDSMLESRQMVRMEDGITQGNIKRDTLPLLAVQGEADGWVPPGMTEYVLSIYGGNLKQSYFVPDAGHPQSIAFGYTKYRDHVEGLLLAGGLRLGQIFLLPESDGVGTAPNGPLLIKLVPLEKAPVPSSVTCQILDDDGTGTTFDGGQTEVSVGVDARAGVAAVPALKLGRSGNFSIMAKANFSVPVDQVHRKVGVVARVVTYSIP